MLNERNKRVRGSTAGGRGELSLEEEWKQKEVVEDEAQYG